MVAETNKVKVLRFCVHCLHEWEEFVDRDELRKIANHEPLGICPNEKCGLPT